MQLLLKIFTNPIGLAINVVHWAIVIFAYWREGNPFKKETALCFHCDHTLFELLRFVNVVPLIIIQIIDYPLNALFGKNSLIEMHLIFLLIFIAIFQWSLVGFAINFLIDFHKPKEIKISLE